jgi:AmmeMemoRadiSam system protein B
MDSQHDSLPTMDDGSERLPAIRPLDITAFRGSNNELYFSMFDMSRIAPRPMAISLPGYFVVAHLDGRRSVADIQAAFAAEFGRDVEAEQIARVVRALDEALLLNTERFDLAHAAAVEAYRQSDARDNRDRWPAAAELQAEIDRMLAAGPAANANAVGETGDFENAGARPGPAAGADLDAVANAGGFGGPGASANAGAVAGLIAPHLDYVRGAPCYADAYATMLRAGLLDAERFVILGANHFGRGGGVDRAFIEALESRLDDSLRHHEFDHAAEHSIELHVHILQALLKDRPFEIVPILCPDPTGPTGTRPLDGIGPDLDDFARALRELLHETDRRTLLIASADLSHVGQRFGEPEPADRRFLKQVGESDRRLLELLSNRREEEFVVALAANGNPTRICSIGSLFTLLRALPNRPCRILRYHQATDFENEAHVTCAAGVVG